MTFKPCIVVPVYNHGAGAAALSEKLAPLGLPLILVNDGSENSCRDALHALTDQHDWVSVIDHDWNRGKGAAVLTGLRAAHARDFTHALQIDADGQHDATDIPAFLDLAKAQKSAVIAGVPQFDDSVPKGRLVARYLTHFCVWVETLSFTIRDAMCGFRVYPLAPVIQLAARTRLGVRMDFDPEIMVRLYWEGVPIISRPTRVTYPASGQSHFLLWRDNWLISWMHTRLVFGMLWRVLCFRLGPGRAKPSAVRTAQ